MALNDYVDLSELGVAGVSAGNGPGTPVSGGVADTGNLRRKYNFGDRGSELAISQDPFFRFVSKVSKKPTDDPQFKSTEKRGSYHKRYAYLKYVGSSFAVTLDGAAACNDQDAADDTFYGQFGTDYSNQGNLTNRVGQTPSYAEGDANTEPKFLLEGQLLRVPVASASNIAGASSVVDYQVIKITNVVASGNYQNVTGTVVKGVDAGRFYMGVPLSIAQGAGTTTEGEEALAPFKCYVVGSAHAEGSGYPETWKDQPYSTNYGRTQIWKTAMAMTNTARATSLKYEGNEWSRVWKEKLIEHKWDMESSLLFGTQSDTYITTQGAVDYILNYGNSFSLDIATKTADDFLDDMSNYLDPRYNSGGATVYFCSTPIYNWMHKLGGYFKNNLEISSNFRADFAQTGKKKILGVDITVFSTPYGDMNVARNIHLDGTDIKILGINMKNCAYRPLVGNGLNRDTSVYVGVQTLENSGVDRRVDLILTEAGMEWSMPESHALWT